MRKNTTDEQRMRTPFGRYVNTINDETDYDDNDEIFSDKDTEEYAEEEEIYEEPVKPIQNKRFKKNKKVTENVPETQPIWTGQTTAIDIIAPTSVDNGSRDYVVVDGIYHSYLYIAGYGYRTHNEAAWMSALVEAGDSIGISFSFKRMQRDKILSRIAQKTMINRSKMRDVADTRSDFEELDSAISSGIYLKEGMNRGNQDFYYMSTIIEVTAEDEETLERYQKQKEEEEKKQKLLLELKGKETITKGGKKINLYANIGGVSDVAEVLANDANGIGLFRSEFLYLQSETFPTEEEQFRAYKTVVETMAGKKVIVRTLDIGADKQVDYFGLDKEDNPALGYRAIRICLKQPDIFRTQLRAIYRASYYGTLSIMFPMIISVDEVRVIKRIVNEVKSELDEQEIPYGTVELGIMIETPAAVMISDLLAKEVDFFSIGTNDLTQYTLAIDRQNPKLDDFYNSHHEAVLRMIRMVVENGHKEGCWVGICGELGADTSLTETFVSMGIDELSVSPSMVLKVREAVRNIED